MARRRKKLGKSAKNARKGQNPEAEEEEYKKCPHSFVFHRGLVGKNVKRLVLDMRHVMEPYTASHLKVNKRNVLKDFISVAGPLNVTHLLTFSKSEVSTYLRLVRLPRGPTMTFKVHSYSLSRDVKRNDATQSQFLFHPLLIMNRFSGDGMHLKLMATMFQNMFPSINVNKLNLNDIKRCVLLDYDPENKLINFRHYNVRVVAAGLSKAVKKLVRGRIPNLASYNDISDFVLRDGNLSESEAELDNEQSQVTLPQDLPGRGNTKSAKSAIRLSEVGPRMTLQLIKIEEGICSGEILYHEYVRKTAEELKAIKEMRQQKKKLREERRKEQEANVKRKQALKDKLREKSLAGMKRKDHDEEADTADQDQDDYDTNQTDDTGESEVDDDAEYYRQEVGQEPDSDVFNSRFSTPGSKRDSKHNNPVASYKQSSVKQRSHKDTDRTSGKMIRDHTKRTNSRTDFSHGRKRRRPIQQNSGKRKKRKT